MDAVDEQLEEHLEMSRETPEPGGAYSGPLPSAVSINWLAQVFRMAPATVRDRLRDCPALVNKPRGGKGVQRTIKYDLPTAAAYLVKPKMATKDYLKAVKRGELPAALQQQVWDAMLKRQKWEENAGQLFRTDAIREVLGGTFQTMKFNMQLWVDTLERQTGVTREQREVLTGLVDGLQNDLYDALLNNAAMSQTGPQITELQETVGEVETISQMLSEDDEDSDIMDMV